MYKNGESVRISANVTAFGSVVNPTDITLTVKPPTGVNIVVEKVNMVNDSLGNFTYDLFLSQAGLWKYRWVSSGTLIGIDEGQFQVYPLAF